jgi:uncharacterized coiled-coil protein SlyX
MADENTGEWKLAKVWECKKCRLLIKDGRKVFDHVCSVKEEEDKLLQLRNILDDKDIALYERDKFIDSQKNKIFSLENRVNGLENFIKELDETIRVYNNNTIVKDQAIEDQKIIIGEQKKTIDSQSMTIEEQRDTLENQKKSKNKVVEKIVYLEKGSGSTPGLDSPNNGNDNVVRNINVDIWQKDNRIKDSKDSGYREEIEVEIFERGKGKEKIIIKNGKVIKKPDDIIIIGQNTQEGFVVKGIYRN